MEIILKGFKEAHEEIARVQKLLKGGQIGRAVQTACVKAVKKRFGQHGKKQNKLGGPSTNYWLRAADSVTSTRSGGTVKIKVSQVGVALHLHGGTVRPRNTSEITGRPIQFLSIPKVAAAHGKTVAMMRSMGVDLYPGRGGLLRQIGAQRDPKNDEMWYVLTRSVTIKADNTVIPGVAALAEAAKEAILEIIDGKKDSAAAAAKE